MLEAPKDMNIPTHPDPFGHFRYSLPPFTEAIVVSRIQAALTIVEMANRFNDTGKLDTTLVAEATAYLRSHFGKST